MTTLALYSNKGGVGKTAAAVNLAFVAAERGWITLVCDLDPQAAATYCFRVRPKLKRKARHLTRHGKAVDRSIKGTDFHNLDLLPADFSHRRLDVTYAGLKHPDERLDMVLKPLRDEYDLIFLDCPPTINVLAENVFVTADQLLVPVTPTVLSARAYEQLRRFIDRKWGDEVPVTGFFSMVDVQNEHHRDLSERLPNDYDGFLRNTVPYLPTVEQMGIHRSPVPAFAPLSRAAAAYRSLWVEIESTLL